MKKPQGDYEAECGILAIFFVHPEKIIESQVSTELFTFTETNIIFAAMIELAFDHQTVDLMTVFRVIEERGEVDKLGGEKYAREFLSGLSESYTTSVTLDYYIERATGERKKYLIHNFIDKTLTDFQSKRPMEEVIADWNIFTAANLSDGRDPYVTRQARDYIEAMEGSFNAKEVFSFVGANQVRDRKAILMTLSRMVKQGELEHSGTERSGFYRKVNADCEVIDITAPPSEPLDLKLPFGLERLLSGGLW